MRSTWEVVDRQVGVVVKIIATDVRKVFGSIPEPVKSDIMSPTARRDCDPAPASRCTFRHIAASVTKISFGFIALEIMMQHLLAPVGKAGAKVGPGGLAPQSTCLASPINKLSLLKTWFLCLISNFGPPL